MAGELVLGIDPGHDRTGWALASEDEIRSVGAIKAKKDMLRAVYGFLSSAAGQLKSFDQLSLVVVEGQQIYPYSKSRPNDILRLGQLAGGILGVATATMPVPTAFPGPADWKKQVHKKVHQARTYAHYGIQYAQAAGYSYPTGCAEVAKIPGASGLNKADWKEVGDAIGLALYGARLIKSALG